MLNHVINHVNIVSRDSRVDCRPRRIRGRQTREYGILFSGRGAYTIFLQTMAGKFAKICTFCGREIVGYSHVIYWKRDCNMQLPGRKTCMFWRTFGRGMMKNHLIIGDLNINIMIQNNISQNFLYNFLENGFYQHACVPRSNASFIWTSRAWIISRYLKITWL